MEKKSGRYEASGIHTIDMKIDCGELVISEAEDITQICIEAEVDENDIYEEYVDNGKLKIRYKRRKRWFNIGENRVYISIQLPKEKQFERFSLKIGAGNADLSPLALFCKRLELEVGAGNIDMGTAKIQDMLNVKIGAGDINLQKAMVENVKVECGVGNCYLRLAGKENDYNYIISCGVGKIKINDSYKKQIGGSESRRNAGAIGNVELSCGVGEIELYTEG